ncbi:peptidoglycan-binding protein [Georgenia satyanarayanai]|nr:peptidoglycan-binding protein [Georgenia satyanarayanai]
MLVLLAGVGGWWAGRATLVTPPEDSGGGGDEVVWAQAAPASVGQSLPLSTTLRQPVEVVAVNTLSGIVTQASPGEVQVGSTVYAVAGVPVRVVAGQLPFYRDLALGVQGQDVAQLQEALIELGHLTGPADGRFGTATARAVRAWQEELGIARTGDVPLGEVLALPRLPVIVQLGEAIKPGRMVAGGEDGVLAPSGSQEFTLVVTPEQARLIPAGAQVEITWQEHTWSGVLEGAMADEHGSMTFQITAADGGPVCGQECHLLPGEESVSLRSEVVVVPPVQGIGVPAAAVRTTADGAGYVLTEQGEQEVQVVGSGQGIAIVEGLSEGTRVKVLATENPTDLGEQQPGLLVPPGESS